MASVKEIAKNKIQIDFEITEEAMQAATQQAYQKNKGKFNVPGFRKGHAPKGMIEKFYGVGIFFEDAFEIAFPDAYSAALKECDVFAVSRPENVDILSMEEGKPMVVKAELYVKPEVELGAYEGVTVTFEKQVVTEEEVAAEIARILEQNARFDEVEREAKNGDKVILDYSGSVDGVKFEGGTAEAQTLDLGSGTFIPGFEEQVVGMKAGEEKDITVTFPEQYHAAELAGKEAVFAIKLISVKEKQLPEADDEFAQDVSEFDTFEEYKASIVSKLEERKEKQNKYALEDVVVNKVVGNAKVEIPACMIENQINYQIQEMEYSLMYQGVNLQQYMEITGTTMEQLREQFRETSENKVKTQLVLEAIKNAMGLEVTEEEMDARIQEFADAQKKSLEEYKKGMQEGEVEYINDRVLYEKLVDALVGAAKVRKPAKRKPKKAEEEAQEAPAAE
ncbi:MAG: trigger factor [Christensenellaceae bacterium]|nr:trigger factor [Christensenellaceae bacterium]